MDVAHKFRKRFLCFRWQETLTVCRPYLCFLNYARLAPNHYCSKCAYDEQRQQKQDFLHSSKTEHSTCGWLLRNINSDAKSCQVNPVRISMQTTVHYFYFFLFVSIGWHHNWLRDHWKKTKDKNQWKMENLPLISLGFGLGHKLQYWQPGNEKTELHRKQFKFNQSFTARTPEKFHISPLAISHLYTHLFCVCLYITKL